MTWDKRFEVKLMDFKPFLRRVFIPYHANPGGFNVDAILVLFGAFVWGICVIGVQLMGGAVIPEVSEIGKACIFVGIGRATKTSEPTKSNGTKQHSH